ncbi:MAG: FAD-dependent thymidylate synthase [Nanoarchaeota archaeon]
MDQQNFAPISERLELSEQDRYFIEPFFTNLDSPVFGITFLPPEVIGALCSRASRAKDDLRVSFLKEFIKPFLEGESQYSESLRALIDFLHKYPAELIFSNPKARDFYITWLSQFGDDSIAQMGGTHLIYTGISQLAIKQIEDMRIGIAPIEKSTRYVDYSSRVNGSYRYYTDPTLEGMGLLPEYKAAMDNLFQTYTELLAKYMEFLKGKYPSEEEKVLRTKAFDTVRLLLPVSTLSQLALFANGQAFEYMINRCLDHRLGEVRWTARVALQELSKVIPAFLRRVETPESEDYRKYLSERSQRVQKVIAEVGINRQPATSTEPAVKLLEYDPTGEDKIIAGLVYGETHEPFEVVLGRVKQLSRDAKERILQEVLKDRKAKYYKIPRPFESANLKFEILMNIGAWRDLHRHRIHTQMRQRFSVHNGFDVPEGLKEAGLDAEFISAISKAEEVFRKIERVDKDLAQYCCTLAHKVRFLQYQNMRSFFWETELRTIPQGHPDYRKIEQEKIRQIERVYPLIAKYLLVDMHDYDFARRGDTAQIQRKEVELKEFFERNKA